MLIAALFFLNKILSLFKTEMQILEAPNSMGIITKKINQEKA